MQKYTRYLKSQGIDPFIDGAAVSAHITHLRSRLSLTEIAIRAGVPVGTVQSHADTGRHRGSPIRPWSAEKILAVRFRPDDLTSDERLLGAQRMFRGLQVLGFTSSLIGVEMGIVVYGTGQPNSLINMNHGKFRPGAHYYEKLLRVAQKFETVNPLDLGATSRGVGSCRTKARNAGWAPIGAWDYETVHLAESFADWTGECGTSEGYGIHRRREIPLCDPCRRARRIYQEERGWR